jgi:hypothetical protein
VATGLLLRRWGARPQADGPQPAGSKRAGSQPAGSTSSPIRRALAILLLPASLLPVVLLAPTLARAPATLVVRLERIVAPARASGAPIRRAPYEPPRYPPGAPRLERDVFETVAGILTPQVGVSVLAEHQTRKEKAHAPILLITGEPQAGSSP